MLSIEPTFNFDKHDFGIGFIFYRENESKRYNFKHKSINYIFFIKLLWFSFGFEIDYNKYKGDKDENN